MTYQIIAETPEKAALLQLAFENAYQRQAAEISEQQASHPGARYVVIDAGFPRALWLVWDCERHDNLRGHSAYPWFTTRNAAQKLADKHNREQYATNRQWLRGEISTTEHDGR